MFGEVVPTNLEGFPPTLGSEGTSPARDYLLVARAVSGFVCLCVWMLTRMSSQELRGDLDPRTHRETDLE